ncbi:hypothetical protein U8C43_23880 [Sinorhizobium meliloti]|nr:hypothetical protein U8C30_23910 [Sinorhizobium meliloti]WQP28902.1 hypothetical protein U8C43_23880 [Sinorhizobium meliloti]
MTEISCSGPQGSFKEIDSGSSVLIAGATSLRIQLDDLAFVFKFASKKEISGQAVEQVSVEGKTLTLDLVNFENPLGVSWQSQVGTLDGKVLVLCLYVTMIGNIPSETRIITHSFYTKEA